MHAERQLPRTTRAAAREAESLAVEWMRSHDPARRDRGLIADALLSVSKAVVPDWAAREFWATVPSRVRRDHLATVAETFRSAMPQAVSVLLDSMPSAT